MKTLRTFIFLIISTNILYGQAYESLFGSESTQWNMTIGNLWGIGSTEHHVIGDTIIDGSVYKIINGYEGLDEIKGFVRQDSISQKAWYRNNQSEEEHLIMDLSLEIGDSLFIQGAWNSEHKYYIVDSIYFKNNRKHIQFDFPIHFMENEKFKLIEGVVSNMGFRYQENDFINGLPTILLCAYKNEQMVYGEGECVVSSIKENSVTSEFYLYPNPVVDNLTLILNEAITRGSIEIISQTGKIKYHKSGRILSTEIIDLKGINTGIYFVRIYDYQTGNYQILKMIKSD